MRLKRTFIVVVGSLLAMGAYAEYDPILSPDPAVDSGPSAKKIVIRRDVGRKDLPPLPPGFKPVKPQEPEVPMPTAASMGHGHAMPGDSVIMATATPQQTLEMRLKSLAKDLR